jgi:hypothetical protein
MPNGAKVRGGAGRKAGGGAGRLSVTERKSPLANVPEGQWINAKEGNRRIGFIFNPIISSPEGDKLRPYGSSVRQGSQRAFTTSGYYRLRDGVEVGIRGGKTLESSGTLTNDPDISALLRSLKK